MHSKLLFVGSVVGLAIITLAALTPTESGEHWVELSRLHTNGKYIEDEFGRKVFLRGVNWGGIYYKPHDKDWLYRSRTAGSVDEKQWEYMEQWGVNVARYFISPDLVKHEDVFRARIDQILEWGVKHGIYTTLTSTKEPEYEFSWDSLVWMWGRVAEIYRGNPNLLYDILNEPIFDKETWQREAQRCVDAIRSVDSEVLILLESLSPPQSWNHTLWYVKTHPINGTNLVYSPHFYFGSNKILPPEEQTIEYLLNNDHTQSMKWVLDHDMPVVVGEYGTRYIENAESLRSLTKILNEWECGYLAWQWHTPQNGWEVNPHVLKDWNGTPNLAGWILINAIGKTSIPLTGLFEVELVDTKDITVLLAEPDVVVLGGVVETFRYKADSEGWQNGIWDQIHADGTLGDRLVIATSIVKAINLSAYGWVQWVAPAIPGTVYDSKIVPWESVHPLANAGPNQTVDEDTLVTFDGSGSSGNIISYTWTFTDVTPRTLIGVNSTYTFATPGIYTVTLNVTDAAGNYAMDTVVITVVDVTAPVANAGLDQIAAEDTVVIFDARGSSDNVGVVSYYWDFGDGTTGTGVTTTHTYTKPGTYTVTLTARDEAGNSDTDTMTVTVKEATALLPWWILGAIAAGGIALAGIAFLRRKRRQGSLGREIEDRKKCATSLI